MLHDRQPHITPPEQDELPWNFEAKLSLIFCLCGLRASQRWPPRWQTTADATSAKPSSCWKRAQ